MAMNVKTPKAKIEYKLYSKAPSGVGFLIGSYPNLDQAMRVADVEGGVLYILKVTTETAWRSTPTA
jgi:hypothetical protein